MLQQQAGLSFRTLSGKLRVFRSCWWNKKVNSTNHLKLKQSGVCV